MSGKVTKFGFVKALSHGTMHAALLAAAVPASTFPGFQDPEISAGHGGFSPRNSSPTASVEEFCSEYWGTQTQMSPEQFLCLAPETSEIWLSIKMESERRYTIPKIAFREVFDVERKGYATPADVRAGVEKLVSLSPTTIQLRVLLKGLGCDASGKVRLVEWMQAFEHAHLHQALVAADVNRRRMPRHTLDKSDMQFEHDTLLFTSAWKSSLEVATPSGKRQDSQDFLAIANRLIQRC